MSHYICNITCYVLPCTLSELCFQSSFIIRVKFLVLLFSLFLFFVFVPLQVLEVNLVHTLLKHIHVLVYQLSIC